MATLSLRRFSEPDTLNAINDINLLELLRPYDDYFMRPKLEVTGQADLAYEKLAAILVKPDASIGPD